MWQNIKEHPIRFFALMWLIVMTVLMWRITNRLLTVLESPDWCGKALAAERISNQSLGGTGCNNLLVLQVDAIADALRIAVASNSLQTVVIVIIVLAGAKAAANLPGGLGFAIGPNGEVLPVVPGAPPKVAVAAPPSAPGASPVAPKSPPEHTGPAMPEPK